jgi:predicted outer membrane repeat protein
VNDFTFGKLYSTLRYAEADDLITFSGVTAGTTTIELTAELPEIRESITIEGNGITLTRTGSDDTSSLLHIGRSAAVVTIRRVHFKNGLATNYGCAIGNEGILTLESCIFSGNQNDNSGGAISSSNTLTIRGCTFYNNSCDYRGGAVYFSSNKTLTLTGNLFYGNTAGSGYPVVYNYHTTPYGGVDSGPIIASYNVVDKALGTGDSQAGWSAGTGDTTFSARNITGTPFNITTFVPVNALRNILPSTAPTDFPSTDFYGAARNTMVPGAVNYAP